MKTSKDSKKELVQFKKTPKQGFIRLLIALRLAIKNILLIPVRLVVFIVNKIGNALKFSLTYRMGLVYTILTLVVLIIFNFSLIMGFKYILLNNEKLSLEEDKNLIISSYSLQDTDVDTLLDDLSRQPLDINVYNDSLVKIYTSNANLPTLNYNIKAGSTTSIKNSGNTLLVTTGTIPIKSQNYYIQFIKDVSIDYKYINRIIYISSILVLILTALVAVFGSIVNRNLLLPITKMTNQIKQITIKNLDRRLDIADAQDELKDLTIQFNSLMDNIEEAYRKQNQFVSDASHELRTPISVINGYVSMLDRWGKKDEAILEEAILAVKDETLQMQSLIEKLLFLARSDRNKIEMEIDNIQLDELVKDICRETEMIDKNHKIICAVEGKSTILGNEKMIKQMMRIFIENAAKFTEEKGEITIGMFKKENKSYLFVKDTGLGISRQDLPHIFDRFYQADKARTKKVGGSGLGLSIAKWIIDQHDASVKAYSEEGVGTTIEVCFKSAV